MLLRFSASWCGPCRVSASAAYDFVKDHDLAYDFVDVDAFPEEAEKYGVQTVPTYVFLDRDYKEQSRLVGPQTRAALDRELSRLRLV